MAVREVEENEGAFKLNQKIDNVNLKNDLIFIWYL